MDPIISIANEQYVPLWAKLIPEYETELIAKIVKALKEAQ